MISIEEAQKMVFERVHALPAESAVLVPDALGRVLAEEVVSDLDLPPFDKALMDGYAVRAADFEEGVAELTVIEEVTAGRTPTRPVNAGEATRIMTGAPLPEGANAVVMIERTRLLDTGRVRIEDDRIRPDLNILHRGREMRMGEVIFRPGMRIGPAQAGVLSAVGRERVLVHPAPVVAVLPTGDEIVPATQKPGPGQIRNSNGPMILAQVARAGGVPHFLGIARDTLENLRDAIARGLEHPVLVLSGGVSAGKLDLVPQVLEEMGVEALFHKVEMKPGKPLFFGVKPHANRPSTFVFGLPGNPVSSLVCFELFVRPTIRGLRGQEMTTGTVHAALAVEMRYKTDRPTYHPARLEQTADGGRVHPLPWLGSADLRGVCSGNAFAVFPKGEQTYPAGVKLTVLPIDDIE
jgi:molybdopterin molybdotransferase